jgi:hypothetical protein
MCAKQALGIPTEGKSAALLSQLVDEATDSPRVPVKDAIIDPNALFKHFEEGRFSDCSIRLRIRDVQADVTPNRPAKRLRSQRSKGTATEGPADGEEGVHLIKAHALVLASRSAYFERAMGGEWRESQDKSFEVEVADETGEALDSSWPMSLIDAYLSLINSNTCSLLHAWFQST